MRTPRTNAGKEMWRLAEAVAVKLEPDGGGPLVDVAILAVQMVREQVVVIEDEAAASASDEGSLDVERLAEILRDCTNRDGYIVPPLVPDETGMASSRLADATEFAEWIAARLRSTPPASEPETPR